MKTTRILALIVTGTVLALGCAASPATPTATPNTVPSPTTAAPTPTSEPTATTRPTWDLVLMGDSVLLQPSRALEARLEKDLGVTLRTHDWINPDLAKYSVGGERSADLLTRLRTDEELRQDLREAEVIAFDVPFGMLNDTCPSPEIPASEAKACFAQALPLYQADVDAIFRELVALRDPSDAIIRATDVWQFLWPSINRVGNYDVVRPAWQAMNRAVADAAARYGIPLVRAYDAFTGPNGERDPVAAGDVQSDEFHLSAQGVERFVELVAALGFEPSS